ncbi:MAG: alanyl-tRNA editing protein [Synergistaceae bacterium]|nr:alanyl-tRNA editing protein [Synergistaceae bacterium]MBR0093704.1 alanyl-tRNA editing protein [Synergistaceae bacterium]
MTEKLYYEDLYAREFDAEVVSQLERDGKFHVILDKTLFFPSGGGQPCDLGEIDGVEVIEVLESGDEIIHVLSGELKNKNVHGVLNWERRFELMQQHLGEHVFAGMLYNLHGLHTARMRIEGDNVSIDIDTPVKENFIFEAEAAANEAVWKDIPVEILYPGMDEVKALARKLPPENAVQPVRIVKIAGVDYVPCCGVHVSSTGQVGLIKITSFENHKGGTRIYLKCGAAAYRWLSSLYVEVRKAESELVCGYEGINEKILNLKSQIKDLKALNEKTLERFLKPLAEDLISKAENKIVRHVMKNSSQDDVKHLFKLITEADGEVTALLAGENSEGVFVMFGTSRENKKIDVRPAFKKVMEAIGGKGGGSSFSSQGWGKDFQALDSALDEAEKSFR